MVHELLRNATTWPIYSVRNLTWPNYSNMAAAMAYIPEPIIIGAVLTVIKFINWLHFRIIVDVSHIFEN